MKKTVERLRRKCWFRVFLCLMCYAILPICLVVSAILVLFWRLFSIGTARLFRPQLALPLSLVSGVLAVDEIYADGEVKYAVVGVYYTDKLVSKDAVLKRMDEIIKGGKFPELEQRLERFMGLYFWGFCPTFNLKAHVTGMPEVINLRDVHLANNTLCRKGFLKDQPLWEITLFPNFVDGEGGSAIALRVHHCLTDGVGHVSLIDAIGGLHPSPQPPSPSWTVWMLDWIRHPALPLRLYRIQYRIALAYLSDYNYNFWIKPPHLRSRAVTFHEGQELQLATLKNAAKSMGHTASEVLMAAFSTAIREDMEAAGEPVPPIMSAFHPQPRPGHPGTLTNHTYSNTLVLPIGVRDKKEQLRQLAAEYRFKRYAAPCFNAFATLFGTIFQMCKSLSDVGPYTSLAVTNFAISSNPWILFGAEIKRIAFSFDMSLPAPLAAMFIGYRDHMFIRVKCRADVMKTDDRPKRIVNTIIREIHHMAKAS